jgi:uncharacterized protein (DUF1697 family)
MKHDLKNLCNDGLINSCKKIAELIPTQLEADHLTELITRFERLSLGQQADEACKKVEELQQQPRQDDEVEALAEKLWVNNYTHEPDRAFIMAETFIQYRNERRGKNGK